MILCLCRSISEKEVKNYIRQCPLGERSGNKICSRLKIGENCGACREYAEKFIAEDLAVEKDKQTSVSIPSILD